MGIYGREHVVHQNENRIRFEWNSVQTVVSSTGLCRWLMRMRNIIRMLLLPRRLASPYNIYTNALNIHICEQSDQTLQIKASIAYTHTSIYRQT